MRESKAENHKKIDLLPLETYVLAGILEHLSANYIVGMTGSIILWLLPWLLWLTKNVKMLNNLAWTEHFTDANL